MKGGGEDEVGSFGGGEYGKKEILKIATLKRACTPQGIYVISSEGLPRILERSPGYAGGYLTLCIRALFPAVTGYTGCPRAKEMSLACDHARFLVISGVRPMCKNAWVELLCLVIRLCDAHVSNEKSSSLKFFELK